MHDQVITVQSHPEFVKDYSQALMDHRRDILGEDVHRAGLASLTKATDERTVFSWLLKFVQEGSKCD